MILFRDPLLYSSATINDKGTLCQKINHQNESFNFYLVSGEYRQFYAGLWSAPRLFSQF